MMLMIKPNLTPTRKHSILSDFGMHDYYKYYVDEMGGTLSSKEYSIAFRKLIEGMRQIVVENNYRYKLPSLLGIITTRKYKNKVTYKDGKVINTFPVDWNSTLKLWEKYPEAAEKKQLVRCENKHSNGHSFKIKYDKFKARYKNKTLYKFSFNRKFKNSFSKFIKENGNIERDLA